jgi:DNA-binding Lrp family transcriptional regulator
LSTWTWYVVPAARFHVRIGVADWAVECHANSRIVDDDDRLGGWTGLGTRIRETRQRPSKTCLRTTLGRMITAIVFVKADVARIPEVAEVIAALDGVSEVYSVTGQIDLIAMIRVSKHEDIASVVADSLNKVEGVTSTETHIAFRTFSRHDLESAFSLGLD